jgi:hypothetical protein
MITRANAFCVGQPVFLKRKLRQQADRGGRASRSVVVHAPDDGIDGTDSQFRRRNDRESTRQAAKEGRDQNALQVRVEISRRAIAAGYSMLMSLAMKAWASSWPLRMDYITTGHL